MVQHSEQRRDEDHRRQNAEREDEAEPARRALTSLIAEDEPAPVSAQFEDRFDDVPRLGKQLRTGRHSQHKNGEPPLQGQAPEDHTPRDGAAVVGKKNGDCQDREHPDETAHPIGDVEKVEPFGH